MNTPVVLASGNLGETPFLDVLCDAWNRDEPTILEVARDSGMRRFWFRDGELAAMTTSNKAESFASMLVKRKKLQASVAESIDGVAAADGLTPAQVMLRDRVLPVPELVREISLWATLLVVDTFAWADDADWRIVAEPAGEAPPETLLELNLVAALRKGVFKRVDPDEVRGMLRPHFGSKPRKQQPLPQSIVGYDLDAHQHAFWESIDGGRTLGDILEFATIPADDAARLLYLLHRTGMVTFEGRPAAAPELDPWGDLEQRDPDSGDTPGEEDDVDLEDAVTDVGMPSVGGVDMSQIRFHRKTSDDVTGDRVSGTFHKIAPHTRESMSVTTGRFKSVEVGIGHADEVTSADDRGPAGGAGLGGLFDDMDLGPAPSASRPSKSAAKPASPRGGVRKKGWAVGSSPGTAAPVDVSGEYEQAIESQTMQAVEDPEGPPGGEGPVVEREDWDRLTTKDKDRIRQIRSELNKMVDTNYFDWFGLSHEAPVGSIKKAYFQMAKLYHPDSLLDEPEPYRKMAEALFANYGEAYETLSDDEARDKYIRKHIYGEKDENDLAMEKVQQILAAENAFKKGTRALDQGRLKDALRHFKEAVEGYEDEAEYVAYYGFTLFRARLANDPDGAMEGIELMKKSIELKEMAPKPYHLLGKAYLRLGDANNAKRYLRRCLKLNADNPEAVRDYRRADDLDKSGGGAKPAPEKPAKKGGLFGSLFGGKKKAEAPSDDDEFDPEDFKIG